MATQGANEILVDHPLILVDHHPLLPQLKKNEQLSIPIEEMLAKFDRSSEHLWRPYQELICIHRVHEKLHKATEPSSYAPLMVSIGPFHRGKESLKAMEECKLHYMRNVLNRTREEHNFDSIQRVFKNCVESIGKMEEKIRQCYSETINLESKEFIEMMVVDGLFIIGIFHALTGTKLVDDKFLFHNIWGKNTLLWDLLLMENQIPIFVLERLFSLTADHKNHPKGMSFQGVALNSFKDNIELPRKINTITKLKLASLGEDVTLLRNQGIITHTLGTDEDVCNIFNKLCSDIYLKDDYYADIHKRVNIYYCDRWNFCKATLRRTYFDNPWAGIYLVAATLFLILSLIGVIIRLLEYVKSKKAP
ncbi:uncharacterized protein LOC113335194 [Papaver somniferum]|uniref:uncharacterized protein LOC113335194 n=1 Tax=Papaver somniferum TaxID=3469 RepID=UPI000E6F8EFA|nr:uncharacterized protein LOC113335194 [Papaver somniferum]